MKAENLSRATRGTMRSIVALRQKFQHNSSASLLLAIVRSSASVLRRVETECPWEDGPHGSSLILSYTLSADSQAHIAYSLKEH